MRSILPRGKVFIWIAIAPIKPIVSNIINGVCGIVVGV